MKEQLNKTIKELQKTILLADDKETEVKLKKVLKELNLLYQKV